MPSLYPDDIQHSLHILGYPEHTCPSSIKELNKRYHILALKYHPDKYAGMNANEETTEKFKEINEAHKILIKNFYSTAECQYNTGYDSILQLFIQTILSKISSANSNTNDIHSIIHQIITKGIQSAVGLFRAMDKHTMVMIYDILSKNQEIFGISREIMDELATIKEERMSSDIVIHLNPSLLDMLLDRVYVLKECGHTYYIPLWYSELHFKIPRFEDNNINSTMIDGEVIVLCDPELPDNVTIDDHNNIYISLDVNIFDLFREQVLPVIINDEIKTNGFVYYIHASDVTLRSDITQQVLLHGGVGIAAMNHAKHATDMYKVDKRANVYANIRLTMKN
jgi:DnaJ domain